MISIKDIVAIAPQLKDCRFFSSDSSQLAVTVKDGIPRFAQKGFDEILISSLPQDEIDRIDKENDYYHESIWDEMCKTWGQLLSPEYYGEQCICAAIMLENGEVWRGHRHHDCIHSAHEAKAKVHPHVQGFITSSNRFVDRREAMKIQRQAGIPFANSDTGPEAQELFSEDLYLREWRSQ